MDNATVKPFNEKYVRIIPNKGYTILNTFTNKTYSDVITDNINKFKAIKL